VGVPFKSQVLVIPIWGLASRMGFNCEVEVATIAGIGPM
jgi:hypothetical protein